MPTEELKPCPNPWCTSTTAPLPCALKREGWRVSCACGVHTHRHATEAEAITAWNTRTPDPAATITALRDRLEKAEGALRDVKHAADGILAPVCAASGRYLYDWGYCPDMIKELHSEGVAIPAKAFRDLYDATDYEIAAQEPTP